jgi:hypothetical protein
MTNNAGIDYGFGKTNIDKDTGIRYGVINNNTAEYLSEVMEPVYPKAHNYEDMDEYPDYDCEPIGWEYEGEGYQLTDCLDSAVMVIKSPYYTYCKYCSPCVPGAGDLNNPETDGVKTYCLNHDFFTSGKAPYPVYYTETNKLVE